MEPGLVDTELGDGMRVTAARENLAGFRAMIPSLPPSDIAELIVVPTVQG